MTNAPATTTPAPAAEPTTTVAAAEKTDAVDKPERLSLSTAPSGSFSQILVLVLLAIGAGAAILFRRRGVQEQPLLDVVATRVLGRGKQLVVVNTGDSRLLLAVTEQGINVLSSTPAPGPGHSELPEMRETNDRSGAGGLLKSMGNKVTGLWGRAPSGPPTEWDHFDRILASTVPPGSDVDAVDADVPSSKFRRAPERPSSPASPTSADLAELTRELHRHNPRRSA
jgi:flagellar biogenesis protein FliO